MTDDGDDIRDIRLMVMGGSNYPGAVWRESVRDLLSEIDRLTAERDALREAFNPDAIAAIIRRVDGSHSLGAGALGEAISRAALKGET